MLGYDPLEGYRDPQAYDLEDGSYDADCPSVRVLAGNGSPAFLQWVCNKGLLRQLASGAADGCFPLDDLCLPEAELRN